jgi:hypothetical protein
VLSSQLGLAEFLQQGPKLTGDDAVGMPLEGLSVAVSADGNTAIVGGRSDNSDLGAAWIFTRTNGVWTQQGSKLVGTGAVGAAQQGTTVALSSDGNTAIVGGPGDTSSGGTGAAWVFTRTNGVWTQQGSKLVGTGVAGPAANQGTSVALSGDGNTAIVGGYNDNLGVGAAWVFTVSNGVWTQQGNKLVGTDVAGAQSLQGQSVALSGDGNTALVGGPYDNSKVGALWAFTRSNGVWTQQGNKLVGTGAVGVSNQGQSVALSGDGNTAIVGGYTDNSQVGAMWVFTQSNGTWTQQGSKLVGTGAVGAAGQGASVALTADGNAAIAGGPLDNSNIGAAWFFTRSNGTWTQQGSKLGPGTGAVGAAGQGYSVALSTDGSTTILGGPVDNSAVGAVWVFVQRSSAAVHDFNGDGYSDIAWLDTSGNVAIWEMNSTAVLNANTSFVANVPSQWAIVGQRDFNSDGFADLLWRDTFGNVAIWEMNGTNILNVNSSFVANVPTNWSIVGTADFNGDSFGDILWQDNFGNVAIWEMSGTTILNQNTSFVAIRPSGWSLKGTGDFNGDGKADILWEDPSGNVWIWLMDGTTITNNVNTALVATVQSQWSIKGTGDFNGDGKADILWQDNLGNVAIWEMNGTAVLNQNSSFVGNVAGQWSIQLTGDYNGDGMSDILWQDTSGNVAIWEMNGVTVLNANSSFVAAVPSQWSIQQLAAD